MSDLRRAIEALILKGRLRGQLTHDDIIEAMSSFDFGPDQFDELLERLVNEGIPVIDEDDDDHEDELVAYVGRFPAAGYPGKIEFDVGARELLKWATWVALCNDAKEVDREHLQAAAQAECPPPEPPKIWDIPFSARALSGLARACAGVSPIDRNDLLNAFGLASARPRLTLSEAFGEKVRQLLEKRGVNTLELWHQLKEFEIRDCMPGPKFTTSEPGRRWQSIVSEVGNRSLGQELGLVLFCILADTSAGSVLKQSGVTEDLVVSLIKALPDTPLALEISPDIRRLFPWEPLSIEALRSLELAWRFSDREQLRPDDLLPMLLVGGSQARLILDSLGALPGVVAGMPTRVRLFGGPGSSPKLSPEIPSVLEIARQAAGDSPIDTGHLLLGLAEIGHPLVSHLKQQIRECLGGPS